MSRRPNNPEVETACDFSAACLDQLLEVRNENLKKNGLTNVLFQIISPSSSFCCELSR